jgi:hypothetical protein
LIVWDSFKALPVKTIYQAHSNGVESLALSDDSLFIATISKGKKGVPQTLSIWDWTAQKQTSIHSQQIAVQDYQTFVRFSATNPGDIVTNGSKSIVFWNWEEQQLNQYEVSLAALRELKHPIEKDRNSIEDVGDRFEAYHTGSAFTNTMFIPDTDQVVSSTNEGDLVLWGSFMENKLQKKPIKIVK